MRINAPALLLAAGAFCAVIAADGRSAIEFVAGGAVALSALLMLGRRAADAAVFAFGFASIYITALMLAPEAVETGTPATFDAVIESVACGEKSQHGVCTLLGSDGRRKSKRRIGLTVADIVPALTAGDIVRFRAELRSTGRYDDIPHMTMRGLNDRASRLSATAVVYKDDITIAGHSDEIRFRLDGIRRLLEERIYASGLPPTAARMLAASTLGSDIDTGTNAAMRDAGISHLLCVSGFHVGVLAVIVSVLLWPLVLAGRLRRYRIYLTLACVWVYAVIAGFTPSVVRAAIMVSSFFIAGMMQRDALSLNALALAFFVVLLIDPYRMFSAGFQLSFAAVAALLLFARQINPVSRKHAIRHRMAASVCAPLAAMAGTAPLMMVWFNKIPLLGVAANAMATVIFPLFMGAGAASVALESAGLPCSLAVGATQMLHSTILWLSRFWADASNSISPVIYADTLQVCACVAALAAGAVVVNATVRSHRIVAGVCVAVSLVAAGCGATEPAPSIMADTYGSTDCILATDGSGARCYVADGTLANGNPYSHILAAHGHREAEMLPLASGADIGGYTVAVAGKGLTPDSTGRCDILLVSRRYRGDIGALLAATHPGRVLLSGALDYERRHAYAAACARADIPYHDLADKAVAIK